MKKIVSQKDLYTEFIRDLYSAEVQEIPALQTFKNQASSRKLSSILHRHIKRTRMQLLRLEDVIDHRHEPLVEEHCRTMKWMIKEAQNLVSRCEAGPLQDAAIIASLKRIKHCEVLVYRMLIEMTDTLGYRSDSATLECNLKDEMGMLNTLSMLSVQKKSNANVEV